MSYNLLSDCFICDLQLLVVLTASERHTYRIVTYTVEFALTQPSTSHA